MIKTGFNFKLILSQTSELYLSLTHFHISIYRTLALFPLEDASTQSDDAITVLDTLSTVVLRVISRVRADFLPYIPSLKNLSLSSGILRGGGIYHLMGDYYCLHS